MKNKPRVIVAVAILLISNLLANAELLSFENWYIAGSPSVSWHNDLKFSTVIWDSKLTSRRQFNASLGGNASIGCSFDLCKDWHLRIEGEAVYRRNPQDRLIDSMIEEGVVVSRFDDPAKGHSRDLAIMGNAYIDIPIYCRLDLYIGGGLGGSFNELEMSSFGDTQISPSSKKYRLFAWQLMSGFSYNATKCIALTAGYRLFATKEVMTPGPAHHERCNNIPITQSIDIGFRVKL